MVNINKPLIDLLPFGLLFLDDNLNINVVNRFIEKTFKKDRHEIINQKVDVVFPEVLSRIWTGVPNQDKGVEYFHHGSTFIVQNQPLFNNGSFSGYMIILYPETLFEGVTNSINSYKNSSLDLQAIFDISYDVIYVTDGEGNTLRVSQACERLWGLGQEELVGKNVYDLEKKGVYSPSIARQVLEKGEKVTSLQTTRTGRKLMVIGTPIKDENGRIIRVVNASRDITEIDRLQSELDSTKKILEDYKKELKLLRWEKNAGSKLVYRSSQMRNIVTLSKKVAEANSTVLIFGETGVGKEVLASYIHDHSHRKNNPFIPINCGNLPEDLLDKEIFRPINRLQTGEVRNIPGLFELANGGTLFLDEVGEMPMSLQIKLLRILSEQEILTEGESQSGKFDVRIIAATSRDLFQDVQNLKFRKDLFYRLNVIPITIPPLREREEDILPLSMHFVQQFNKEYASNKTLGHDVMDVFLHYDWPGNVRELRNMIERLLVTSDKQVISRKGIPEHLDKRKEKEKEIEVKKIIPLKKAIELLERNLLELAQKEYQSTTKIAQVLDVNQSTVSRKLQKYLRSAEE